MQTDGAGNLEWSTDGINFTDIVDLSRSDLESVAVNVKYGATSDADFQQLTQNLFDTPISTTFIGNLWAPGVDLNISALDIEVVSNATVSTRELTPGSPDQLTDDSIGDSGNLTLNAPKINVASGARLLAQEGNTSFNAGDVTLMSVGDLDDISSGFITLPIFPADISIARSMVNLESATILGRDISVTSSADASDLFADSDSPGAWGEALQEFVGSISVGAGVAVSKATADVIVDGGTIGGRDLNFSADSATDAEALVLTAYGAVAYGQAEPSSNVEIKNGAQLTASNNASITTMAESEMNIQATQNLIGTSTTVERYNITLNGAYSKLTSKTSLSANSSINAGNDLIVDVDATRSHNTNSLAGAYGDGTLATAINVMVTESTLEALIDGTVTVGNDLTVTADLGTTKQDATASATVGSGPLSGGLLGTKVRNFPPQAIFRGLTGAFNRLFSSTGSVVDRPTNTNEFDVAAAISVGVSFNDIEVRIGPNAVVDVGNDILLRGRAEEEPENSTLSFLNSSDVNNVDTGRGSFSQREDGIAAAITGGYVENEVDVYIGAKRTGHRRRQHHHLGGSRVSIRLA